MTDLKTIISKSDRYSDFTLLDKPVKIMELFPEEDFDLIQMHSTQTFDIPDNGKDIVGFCGVMKRVDGIITSVDGDSYGNNISVLGYERFTNEEHNVKNGIEVLVGEEW